MKMLPRDYILMHVHARLLDAHGAQTFARAALARHGGTFVLIGGAL